jgi:hypothetical protein
MASIPPASTSTSAQGIFKKMIKKGEDIFGIRPKKPEKKPDPAVVLNELKKDPTIELVRQHKTSLRSTAAGPDPDHNAPLITREQKEKAVIIIQRALAALDQMKMPEPSQRGMYGFGTIEALAPIQATGGIKKNAVGSGGYMVGAETLRLLEIALKAKVQDPNISWNMALEEHFAAVR